jgi:hypothetical protein
MTITANPNYAPYGYCHHGLPNGECDYGGCDEFLSLKREEEAEFGLGGERLWATEKQMNYVRLLVSKKDITSLSDERKALVAKVAEIASRPHVSAKGDDAYNVIDLLKDLPDLVTEEVVDGATPKQIGFIKSLLRRKAHDLGEVDLTTLTKKTASDLIKVLNDLQDKGTTA